jgi:RNA polymerase sigma factor (sigma-70 family)
MAGELVPYDDIQTRQNRGAIGITAITRLKHADLFAAAKKFKRAQARKDKRKSKLVYGGQGGLARRLKVSQIELGQWINLRRCPPTEPRGQWTARRLMQLEADLFELTGKTMEQLFPQELRDNIKFLSSPKVFERTVEVEQQALAHYAEATRERMLLANQIDPFTVSPEQLKEQIREVLSKFTPKEREIVEYRYGLNDKAPLTYKEIGEIFKVGSERIRQIEAKVIRNLQERAKLGGLRNLREVIDADFE